MVLVGVWFEFEQKCQFIEGIDHWDLFRHARFKIFFQIVEAFFLFCLGQ